MNQPAPIKYTKKDFTSSKDVKWCPGCGDYAILATVQKTMADLGRPKEKQVVVSGIGCSSRFPVYMDTHGFHTIHGRAPTVATGLRVARPDLDVWMVTGDGDGLSIGGNHLMHAVRRNVEMVVLLFNNRIYGLTKGQYSPTSEQNKVTKSTPYGSVDAPLNPLLFALAAGATFVARTWDTNPRHMDAVFKAARQHKGLSLVEIWQNCVIFNDGAFDNVVDREVKEDRLVELEEGKPILFGKDKSKCLVLDGLDVVVRDTALTDPAKILVHNPRSQSPTLAMALAQLSFPDAPTPMGILRQVERPTYDGDVNEQAAQVLKDRGPGNMDKLLRGSASWKIETDEVFENAWKPFVSKKK